MNEPQPILTAGVDVAEDRIEMEIEWSVLESEARTCLSCGAQQRADGSIPCGH